MADKLKVLCLCSVLLFVSAKEQENTSKSCQVARLKPQANFDLTKFMGEWHIISDKAIFPYHHNLDSLINVFTNIRAYGVLLDGHQVKFQIVSRVMGVCVTSELNVERKDFKTPAKLEVSSPNAWMTYLREARPLWVAWTDGDAGLLYSCAKENEDGSCHPDHTYSWTVNRNSEGHTDEQHKALDAKIEEFCMDPTDFKEMKRSWPCSKFDVEKLEQHYQEESDDQAASDDNTGDSNMVDEAASNDIEGNDDMDADMDMEEGEEVGEPEMGEEDLEEDEDAEEKSEL